MFYIIFYLSYSVTLYYLKYILYFLMYDTRFMIYDIYIYIHATVRFFKKCVAYVFIVCSVSYIKSYI